MLLSQDVLLGPLPLGAPDTMSSLQTQPGGPLAASDGELSKIKPSSSANAIYSLAVR